MPSPPRSRLIFQVALIALIAVSAGEASGAYLTIFARSPLVIFDDPATPAEDEILSVSSPASETWAYAASSTCLAVTAWRRLACSTAPSPGGPSGVRSDVTRAPPCPDRPCVGR
jgi:hypothetical protein